MEINLTLANSVYRGLKSDKFRPIFNPQQAAHQQRVPSDKASGLFAAPLFQEAIC